MLVRHRMLDTLGYLTWTLYDFDEVPLAEFRYPWQRGAQAHMGLFRRDGRAKVAATLVAPHASLVVPNPPIWRQWTKPFWLLIYAILLLLLGAIIRYHRRLNT